MSDGLITSAPAVGRPGVGATVRQAVWVVLLFAVVGAGAGVLWYWLWTPASGVVVGHTWYPDETGLRRDFGGTGWYVAVAAPAGLCLGIVVAWAFARSELVTLGAVCVGSVLAAWLMVQVGEHLGPPDPVATAKHTADNKHLDGDLRVHGLTPWFSFPTGALLGLAAVYFAHPGRSAAERSAAERRPGAAAGGWAAGPAQPGEGQGLTGSP